MKNNQCGIALIQVLIISIILSMLAIYISQTVRSQVAIASSIKQHQEYVLAIESAEAELLHLMLTEKLYRSKDSSTLLGRWNFYGEPFQFNDKTFVSIQDLSSLLSLNHINRRLAQSLFVNLGKQDEEIRVFLDSLTDWKDSDDLKHLNGAESQYYEKVLGHGPRNSYLQTIDEVQRVKNGNMLNLAQWQQYFSLSLISSFNPINAPKEILAAYVNDEQVVSDLMQLRNENQLNGLTFFQATGIDEDDFISFRTGSIFRVKIFSKESGNKINKSMLVEIKTRSVKSPIHISEVVWNTF